MECLGIVAVGVVLLFALNAVMGAYAKCIGFGFARDRALAVIRAGWLGGVDGSLDTLQEMGGSRRFAFVKRIRQGTPTRFFLVVENKWFTSADMALIVSVLTGGGTQYRYEGEENHGSLRLIVDCDDDLDKAITCATRLLTMVFEVGPGDLVRVKTVGGCNSKRSMGWDEETLRKNGATPRGFIGE